jgi:hypothetical protein
MAWILGGNGILTFYVQARRPLPVGGIPLYGITLKGDAHGPCARWRRISTPGSISPQRLAPDGSYPEQTAGPSLAKFSGQRALLSRS